MKIRLSQLRSIIKEEVKKSVLKEAKVKHSPEWKDLPVSPSGQYVAYETAWTNNKFGGQDGNSTLMFGGKTFPTPEAADTAIRKVAVTPPAGSGWEKQGYDWTKYGVDTLERWQLQHGGGPVGAGASKAKSPARMTIPQLSKQIADIVGQGVRAADLSRVAELVKEFSGKGDPEAVELIADELGAIMMDYDGDLDFNGLAVAQDIATAFGL